MLSTLTIFGMIDRCTTVIRREFNSGLNLIGGKHTARVCVAQDQGTNNPPLSTFEYDKQWGK